MKLLNSFNHSFSAGYDYVSEVYDAVKDLPGLNGLYLCDTDYLEFGKIGKYYTTDRVITWYNLLFDTNYLYNTNSTANNITLVEDDPEFNGQPSINFEDSGTGILAFSTPIPVGTLIIVYLTRVGNSYLINAPRSSPPPDPIYWDAWAPGLTTLWANETASGSSVYNATSRINGRPVTGNTFIPLDRTRILTVTDIDNVNQFETINGFGGRTGTVGGGSQTSGSSVRGKIAAIITTSEPTPLVDLAIVEGKLAQIYIDYNGTVISSTPSFRNYVGVFFSFDFATIAVDEWFDITSYALVGDPALLPALSFVGSVLSGTVTFVFEGTLTISITNSNAMTNMFSFSFETVVADPIVNTLPKVPDIGVVLSARKDGNSNPYGIYHDVSLNVTKWEDARRLTHPILYANTGTVTPNEIVYVPGSNLVNFSHTSGGSAAREISGTSSACKTMVWVYKQKQTGTRILETGFPDIFNTGVLWTTPSSGGIFGDDDITKLIAKVNRVAVTTFNYILPLNGHFIISATIPLGGNAIPINAFSSLLKGELEFFCGWEVILTEAELNTAVEVLAEEYFPVTLLVFNTDIEYRYLTDVTVDLKKKVTELTSRVVSYTILVNHYGATINGQGILSFTCPTDDFITFTIRATTSQDTVDFSFSVNITLLTNQLYINLKTYLNTFSAFFIVLPETTTLSSGNITTLTEYRTNGMELDGNNGVPYTSLYSLDNKPSANFRLAGDAYLRFNTPSLATGACFIMGYVRAEGQTGKAFLYGQDTSNYFNSGDNGQLLSSPFSGDIWCNGATRDNTYVLAPEVLNVVIYNSDFTVDVNTIAKDRTFTDRSVKGYIPFFCILPSQIDPGLFPQIEQYVRDYYESPKTILRLNFDLFVTDTSDRNKTITSNLTEGIGTIKKFGSGGFPILLNSVPSYILVPNQSDFVFLQENFTIAGWFLLNKSLEADKVTLYSQTDLILYLSGDTIYLGRNNTIALALASTTVTISDTVFNHFAIDRKDQILRLYINGTKIYEAADTLEYLDYNTDILLGSLSPITTLGVNLVIDSVVTYRRTSLYNQSSISPLPSSPY